MSPCLSSTRAWHTVEIKGSSRPWKFDRLEFDIQKEWSIVVSIVCCWGKPTEKIKFIQGIHTISNMLVEPIKFDSFLLGMVCVRIIMQIFAMEYLPMLLLDQSPAFVMFWWYHEKVRKSHDNVRISHDIIRSYIKISSESKKIWCFHEIFWLSHDIIRT